MSAEAGSMITFFLAATAIIVALSLLAAWIMGK